MKTILALAFFLTACSAYAANDPGVTKIGCTSKDTAVVLLFTEDPAFHSMQVPLQEPIQGDGYSEMAITVHQQLGSARDQVILSAPIGKSDMNDEVAVSSADSVSYWILLTPGGMCPGSCLKSLFDLSIPRTPASSATLTGFHVGWDEARGVVRDQFLNITGLTCSTSVAAYSELLKTI